MDNHGAVRVSSSQNVTTDLLPTTLPSCLTKKNPMLLLKEGKNAFYKSSIKLVETKEEENKEKFYLEKSAGTIQTAANWLV